MNRLVGILAIAGMSLLAACAQTQSSMQLANKTNAVVLTVTTQLQNFRSTQERVAAMEAARLGQFLADTVEMEGQLKDIMSQSDSAEKKQHEDLQKLTDEIAANARRPQEAAVQLQAKIAKAQEKLAVPEENLSLVSKNLTILGEERDFKGNVAFFIKFGKSVKVAIDKAKKERDEALKQAAAGQ